MLEWIQDINWPVAKPISEYLVVINENISQEIIAILKTNDEVWKYWTISIFGKITNDQSIQNEIIRIAKNPTENEIEEKVSKIANEIIIIRKW